MTTEQQYIASLDIEASYNLAKQMEAYRTNPVLGYRPAGSKAEFETGKIWDYPMSARMRLKWTVGSLRRRF